MITYLFNLGNNVIISIEAPNKVAACEKFAEEGYDPSCLVSIDKDLGGVL